MLTEVQCPPNVTWRASVGSYVFPFWPHVLSLELTVWDSHCAAESRVRQVKARATVRQNGSPRESMSWGWKDY